MIAFADITMHIYAMIQIPKEIPRFRRPTMVYHPFLSLHLTIIEISSFSFPSQLSEKPHKPSSYLKHIIPVDHNFPMFTHDIRLSPDVTFTWRHGTCYGNSIYKRAGPAPRFHFRWGLCLNKENFVCFLISLVIPLSLYHFYKWVEDSDVQG